jgi:peptidoglycan L-alanyl-D-glutamate endopeptidase CwlK
MAKFGKRSLKNLEEVHPKIVDVLLEAIQYFDFSVLEGVRSSQEQALYFSTGKSQTLNSKHLRQSDGYSHAVDLAPYPIDWEDTQRFAYMAGLIIGIAKSKGINLIWGHDWDGDGDFQEHSLKDGPHFELRN